MRKAKVIVKHAVDVQMITNPVRRNACHMNYSRLSVWIGAVFGALLLTSPVAAQTLQAVKARGALNCGVSEGLYGFSARDDKGNWNGFDVEMCSAVAAAIFNDTAKINYTPLEASRRFDPLRSGDIDLLSRNTTWTMSREIELGLSFAAVNYYDGQGFLIRRAMNKETALDLDGVKVCLQTGTTTELNLADFFRANKMKYQVIGSVSADGAIKAYDAEACNVLTADVSQLFAMRLLLSKPDDHIILPDVISKEPLGPVVRQGDNQWFNIVKWVYFAMVNAEELGVTSKNIDEAMTWDKPGVKRLLGTEGSYGEPLGLTKDWAARVIKLVGNYGEVFERTVGVDSALGIPRGINQLWSKGGIQYAPPIR
jgi:general L-amino acid transport system substrate-binding protein